jgi:hypothetical protein
LYRCANCIIWRGSERNPNAKRCTFQR